MTLSSAACLFVSCCIDTSVTSHRTPSVSPRPPASFVPGAQDLGHSAGRDASFSGFIAGDVMHQLNVASISEQHMIVGGFSARKSRCSLQGAFSGPTRSKLNFKHCYRNCSFVSESD